MMEAHEEVFERGLGLGNLGCNSIEGGAREDELGECGLDLLVRAQRVRGDGLARLGQCRIVGLSV